MSRGRVIRLDNVGVRYRRYARPQDALLEWLLRRPRHQEFHALQGISLELAAGEALGVIGDNGAGKSTLLRVLAGNLPATEGRCTVQGRCAALLELGVGLQPEASGVDNACLGLALRGLDPGDVARYLPQVLEFAELGDFATQPLRTYSSGMAVRLGFAIAVVSSPTVLIVDEALSVGDQYFQKKSLDRMRSLLANGATLVFCSHNLYQVREMCGRAVWLERGRIRMLGQAQAVVDAYQDAQRARQAEMTADVAEHGQPVNGTTRLAPHLLEISLSATQFMTHQPFQVTVQADRAGQVLADIHVGIVIRRNDGIQCFGISTLHDGVQMQATGGNAVLACFTVDSLPLLSGDYCLEVWLIDGSGVHVYDARERCCPFRVQQASQSQGVGMVWLPHRWDVRQSSGGMPDALAS